jgi:NlpC/P60 family putative phage cell wall peptidase
VSGGRIVTAARGWLGTPYRHQAALKGVGCDCLGLLRGVWAEVIGPEPETPPPYHPDWAEQAAGDGGAPEPLLAAARRWLSPVEGGLEGIEPGDVLVFRWRGHLPAKHLAIVSGPGLMIHAHDGAVVCEVAFSPWWRRHVAGAFRFPQTDPATAAGEPAP